MDQENSKSNMFTNNITTTNTDKLFKQPLDPDMSEINSYIENLDFENASILLQKKLEKDPNNVHYIDTLSEVMMSLNDTDSAIKLIQRSIQLEPNKNGDKYMTLGQLESNYKQTLKMYQKGVNLFTQELEQLNSENSSNSKIINVKNSLASAYSAIAELYMNSDLCNDVDAEETCEKCLAEAIKLSPHSHDALIQYANLRILRRRDEEALKYMQIIYDDTMNLFNQNEDLSLPNCDILLNLSKNYAELMQYLKAIKILDILLKIDDEDLECWYLLAYNHFTIKNFLHAQKCLKNFKRAAFKVSHKTDSVQEFECAANELQAELDKIQKQHGELKNNNIEESEDNEEERMMNSSQNTDEMNID